MKLLSRNVEYLIKYKKQGKYCTAPAYIYPSKDDEYTERPEYPAIEKINPNSPKGIQKQWFDKIKRQLTVEEKLFEVTVQRRYGWKCFMIHEGIIPLNNLVFAQHMTKTHVIENEKLPDFYENLTGKCQNLLDEIRNDVIDAIEYQLSVNRPNLSEFPEKMDQEKEITRILVTELNRILLNSLWEKEPHLKLLEIDYTPRIEAYWKMGSLVETFVRKVEKNQLPVEEIPEEFLERPSDKFIQYIGKPILQLRARHPLPSVLDMKETSILGYPVPVYKYDPHVVLGYELNRKHLTNIPGFWPGEENEFSFISYHFSNHIKTRPLSFGVEDQKEALVSQALFASFGWLMPLACYQGFSSFHDITYPMVTQTVLTDGREFTFATYQLNTTEMHLENLLENLKANICWVSSTQPLYGTVEDGKIKDFNEEVLGNLIKYYLNMPKPLVNVELKPYLGDKIKHVADYEDNEKAKWLEEKYKKYCVNKPVDDSKSLYEVYDWERIYKIQFPSRPQDALRRPFELRQQPYREKVTEVEYIPKPLRPDKHLPKWRQKKLRKTFFPQ